ncbi:U1 small nuclear ribonucleoprotein C-like [Hibiscus syriacus]|uniref:U1 small nuclear ribonucleoprotein C-like n=1 Tax=Hibiscus syriacus TaxID=106335 RepID=UPI00192355CC|nr:U1 small nuclear ribonucleoprotein C-like [Hibiscus syriacus]
MPRYYCDYCDTYLTHDSPSVRKQHNAGYKHKANVRIYYQQFEEQQTQSLIDQRIKEHLGQAATFQQVGASFNQHLMAQRPRLPILPTPVMQPLIPRMRLPVLPRPAPGAPGYVPVPGMLLPPMVAPPGAPLPGQINGLPRPPTLAPPTKNPGTATTPTSSNGPPSIVVPSQVTGPATQTSGGFDNANANSQPSGANN